MNNLAGQPDVSVSLRRQMVKREAGFRDEELRRRGGRRRAHERQRHGLDTQRQVQFACMLNEWRFSVRKIFTGLVKANSSSS